VKTLQLREKVVNDQNPTYMYLETAVVWYKPNVNTVAQQHLASATCTSTCCQSRQIVNCQDSYSTQSLKTSRAFDNS